MPGIEREELEGLRNDLAAYRKIHAQWAENVKAIEEQNSQTYSALKLAKEIRDGAEQDLRKKLCDFFYLTSDKQPVPGLSIKEVKNVVYDTEKATDWVLGRLIQTVVGLHVMGKSQTEIVDALCNDALFLVLDGAAIKKAAESGMFGSNAPFKVEKVAQATIATDLSKFLE